MSTSVAIPIQDATGISEARRAAALLGQSLALDETAAGQLAIVVTEAATNLFKHAGGGSIVLNRGEDGGAAAVEMLAIDKGPGIENVERCMADGYSTAGSPGNGLGAISRLSYLSDIYSNPGRGTIVLARIRNQPSGPRTTAPRRTQSFEVGAISVPKRAQEVCGDAWSAQLRERGIRVLVVDGLGHGLGAFEASRAAVEIAANHTTEQPLHLLERLHAGLRATRGAAVSVVEIDVDGACVSYAGLGNIAGSLITSDGPRHQMISYNGTAGHNAHKILARTYPWTPESVMVLHSDGVATHWSLDKYPGLLRRHPSVIAAVLYRDFLRGSDDATVVVVRRAPGAQENGR